MSRFYTLNITDGTNIVKQWTSHPQGRYDAAAQNIVFDIPIVPYDIPAGTAVVTVQGVSLADLGQTKNYRDYGLELYAGMAHGLPIANMQPAPALILKGQILESFGNWVGNDMTLSFFIAPPTSYTKDGAYVFSWSKGQTLQSALTKTFDLAMPGVPQRYSIKDIVATHDEHGVYHHLDTFGKHIFDRTVGLASMPSGYPGVHIAYQKGEIVVWDYGSSNVTALQIEDLIGQPTWVGSDTLMVITAMRPDVQVGDKVKMPDALANLPGIVTTIPSQANAYFDYNLTFKGQFTVVKIRQVGDFRSPEGAEWATAIGCVGDPHG